MPFALDKTHRTVLACHRTALLYATTVSFVLGHQLGICLQQASNEGYSAISSTDNAD